MRGPSGISAAFALLLALAGSADAPRAIPPTGPYYPPRGRQRGPRRRMRERGKFKSIAKPRNPKTKNRVPGTPKRTEWLVCRMDDREALQAIGERCVRGWREGESIVRVRHASSLTPGARR